MSLMNKMMFTVYESKLGFDETVATLKTAAEENGWEIPMVHDLQKKYRDAGYEDMTQVKVLYLCDPHGGYKILKDDANKPMSVMMPMGVSVYETNKGQVFVAGMNLGRMSMMQSGTVKAVLQNGAVNFSKAVQNIGEPIEEPIEIKKNGGRCCLGCLSILAVLGALIAVIAAIFVKVMPIVMPKMMAKMMPRMMNEMEKTGVQPPCAKIILDHLEAEK